MEAFAENRTEITKKRFYRAMAVADHYRTSALRGMGLLGVIWLVLLAVTLVMDAPLAMAAGELGLLALVSLWLLVVYPRSKYRRAFTAFRRKNDGDLTRHIFFYEDRFVTQSGGSTVELSYAEITQVQQTEELLVLTCEDRTGVIIDRSGFTKGSCEAVVRKIQTIREETE